MTKRKKPPKAATKRKKELLVKECGASRQCMLQFLQRGKEQKINGQENVILLCSDDENDFKNCEQSARCRVGILPTADVTNKVPLSTSKVCQQSSATDLKKLLQQDEEDITVTAAITKKKKFATPFQAVPRQESQSKEEDKKPKEPEERNRSQRRTPTTPFATPVGGGKMQRKQLAGIPSVNIVSSINASSKAALPTRNKTNTTFTRTNPECSIVASSVGAIEHNRERTTSRTSMTIISSNSVFNSEPINSFTNSSSVVAGGVNCKPDEIVDVDSECRKSVSSVPLIGPLSGVKNRKSRFSIIQNDGTRDLLQRQTNTLSHKVESYSAVVAAAAALSCFICSFHREVESSINCNIIFHNKNSYHVAYFTAYEQPESAVPFQFLGEEASAVGKVISVTQPETLLITKLVLCGGWMTSPVDKGTKINVIIHDVEKDNPPPLWGTYQGRDGNLISALGVGADDKAPVIAIIDPEIVTTATDTSASVQCMRRAWLSSICKPSIGNGSHAAVTDPTRSRQITQTGTIIHRVVQKLISPEIDLMSVESDEVISKAVTEALQDPSINLEVFSCTDDDRLKLLSDLPAFNSAIRHCVQTLKGRVGVAESLRSGDSRVQLQVTDIEKPVACADHGMRGIVDVEGVIQPGNEPCALEIKTMQHLPKGRAILRSHHKAQLFVYLLLSKTFGQGGITTGMLAYLPKGSLARFTTITRETLWNEIVHVIRLRNRLARYIKKSKVGPPPNYTHQMLCRWCSNTEACLALAEVNDMTPPASFSKFELIFGETGKNKPTSDDSQDTPLTRVGSAKVGHASILNNSVFQNQSGWKELQHSQTQLNYLRNWDRWMSLELAASSRSAKYILSRQRGNIISLCMRPQFARLRSLVIEKQAPNYDTHDSKQQLAELISLKSGLNEDQNIAINKILKCKDYHIVQGLPGTGKSFLIAKLVSVLAAQRQNRIGVKSAKILITSGTNSAVDTIAMKIMEIGSDVRLVRVASSVESVHERVRPFVFRASDFKNHCEIDQFMNSIDVVLCTAHSVHHPIVGSPSSRYEFDFLIVDEAAQLLQSVAVGPMLCCSPDSRFVLVGDHFQLPPVVRSEVAREEGANVSLLQCLATTHPSAVTTLTRQFRMNAEIAAFSNLLMYNGSLIPGADYVARQRLYSDRPVNLEEHGRSMKMCLSAEPPVLFIDTSLMDFRKHRSCIDIEDISSSEAIQRNTNESNLEADMALRMSKLFNSMGISSVGVITPFRPQLELLKHLDPTHPDIYSIDQSQGKDMEVVIITLAKSPGDHVGPLVRDPRRLNVAFTRAKKKLICIGAFSAVFDDVEEWKGILAMARNTHAVISPHEL